MIKSENYDKQVIVPQKNEQKKEHKSEIIRTVTNNISILNEYMFNIQDIDKNISNNPIFRDRVKNISNKITNITLALRTFREYVVNFKYISEDIYGNLVKFVENLMVIITKNPFLVEHVEKIV